MKNKNNKIVASAFIAFSGIGMLITKDATMFVFSLMIGVPLFFSKRNYIN